jgi:hypothetical protein
VSVCGGVSSDCVCVWQYQVTVCGEYQVTVCVAVSSDCVC